MKGKYWGGILIILGILGLLDGLLNLNLLTMGNFWPAIILGIGLIFEYGYFTDRRNPGLLVPGGIMTVLGILFFFETFTNWSYSEYTWPVYILSVAFGLFQLYMASGRPAGLLIPVSILSGISLIFILIMIYNGFFSQYGFQLFWGILLIAAGILILIRSSFKWNRRM